MPRTILHRWEICMLRKSTFLVGLFLSGVLLAQNVVVNPTGSQSVKQPSGTQLNVNSFENTIYVDQFNWSISPCGSYSAGSNTLTFTSCPLGLPGTDTLSNKTPHWVYITGGTGTPEPVLITGGTCPASGTSGGTITFTTAFAHSAAFTVASATGGAQEAESYVRYLKDSFSASLPIYVPFEIVLPVGNITNFYAPLYLPAPVPTGFFVDSFETWRGGLIQCNFYADCIQVGDTWQSELLFGPT
jgi:hypothetical protein